MEDQPVLEIYSGNHKGYGNFMWNSSLNHWACQTATTKPLTTRDSHEGCGVKVIHTEIANETQETFQNISPSFLG